VAFRPDAKAAKGKPVPSEAAGSGQRSAIKSYDVAEG
jgi:hypothetical protein